MTERCVWVSPEGVKCGGENGHFGVHWHWSEEPISDERLDDAREAIEYHGHRLDPGSSACIRWQIGRDLLCEVERLRKHETKLKNVLCGVHHNLEGMYSRCLHCSLMDLSRQLDRLHIWHTVDQDPEGAVTRALDRIETLRIALSTMLLQTNDSITTDKTVVAGQDLLIELDEEDEIRKEWGLEISKKG